jgi:hypothetical protein
MSQRLVNGGKSKRLKKNNKNIKNIKFVTFESIARQNFEANNV